MRDTIGKLPTIKTKHQALEEVLKIASDQRAHILWEDHAAWLELKLKAIRILAKRGLKRKPNA